jgi:hypothetical protein
MSRLYIFADEAGCMEFSRKPNVSRYFIATTVSLANCEIGDALSALRRELAWSGHELGDYFHAAYDKQSVRDAVYKLICGHDFKVQATILEKSKADPKIARSKPLFYQHAWFYHFRRIAKETVGDATELMVVTASMGTKKERTIFKGALEDVLKRTLSAVKYASNFCPAAADPCLSLADYCAWAIQRKWESPDQRDTRSYNLLKDRITDESDWWSDSTTQYY